MRFLLTLLLMSVAMPVAAQGTYTVAWDASETPNVAYRIYVGPAPSVPTSSVDVGASLSAQIALEAGTYYLHVRAYNGEGESGPSNEIALVVPDNTPPPPPPPPPVDPCEADPLSVSVSAWPAKNGKGLSYTASQPIASYVLHSARNKVTAITFTDTRTCSVLVSR